MKKPTVKKKTTAKKVVKTKKPTETKKTNIKEPIKTGSPKVDFSDKIIVFKSKIPKNIRNHNVAPFAKEFFGENFEKSTVKTGVVTITLINGEKIQVAAL